MLAEVREKCGLGSPPKDYYQNANEAINSLIKRVQESYHSKKQFGCSKRKSMVKKKTSNLLFLEKVKSTFIIIFRKLV